MYRFLSPAQRAARPLRTFLTLVAALLALPTFLIAGGSAAGAAEGATARPPTTCVNDVERQFNSLKHHPEALGFHLGADAYNPTAGRHYQGVARLPGEGTPRLLTTRNGNPGALEPLSYPDPGEVNVVRLGSREANGERVRSNRLLANTDTQDVAPPTEDAVVKSLKFDGNWQTGLPAYRHLGGLQMWGDIAVIGMDRPFGAATDPFGMIVFMNFANPEQPYVVNQVPLEHNASSIGVAAFGDGRLLIVTTGNDGSPVYGYEVKRGGQPTTDITRGSFGLSRIFEYDAANADVGWPTGKQSPQTTNLFKDCGSGELYMLGAYSLTVAGAPLPDVSRDRIGLWRVDPTRQPPLSLVTKRQVWCDFDNVSRMCHMAAASGFHVTPGGDLLLYATEHDNDGPQETVRMAEFSSQDGYDQDRAYRPVAVPGSYKGAVDAPITVDGTASQAAFAQGRVELYDEPNFRGRGLVIDYPDHGKEDYRHLGRVDAYNDEASSVRWRLPARCEAVLYDDKDYRGPKRSLPGGDGSAQNITNLQSFGDDTTSVQFYGDCDGRIVSWSWDLDDDKSEDGTGPKPTITPKTGGVHPLALTVCSGFGVCHKAVGTLDASAGTPPRTKAVVNGTAGTNGWHRSTVNVVLTATGDPTPTEIRYSATGADAMNERTVAGSTATVVVDAQGETVVHFRAVNSSGHEADQTVTVKVDTGAPTLTVRAPIEGARYATGTQVAIQVDCADAVSGVASCPSNGTALDTTGTGARTVTGTGTDAAGNAASKVVNYTVTSGPTVPGELVYVVQPNTGPEPIQRSNTDGSNVVQLVDRGDDAVWSPDGSRVAYTAAPNGRRQVHVVNRDGSGAVAITNSTTWNASSPTWSPDGSRIAYSAIWTEVLSPTQSVTHHAVMTVPASGGPSTTVVASDEVDLTDPTYARNGSSITYVAGSRIMSVHVAGVTTGQLGTVLVDGLADYRRLSYPVWSPDGSTLVFQLSQSEVNTSDLYAWNGTGDPVSLTGTDSQWPPQQTPDAPNEYRPSWLADGRVLFIQDGNVWAMPAQRGAAKVLLADFPWNIRHVDASGA